MDKLDKQLRRLSKVKPSKGFIRASKNRLMQQIRLQKQENWFRAFLEKIGRVQVLEEFKMLGRIRLLHKITRNHQPLTVPVNGFTHFLFYAKRAVASTLVMMIAVTSTLFFVEGNTVVEASDNSYLEVITGQVSVKHPDLIVWEDIHSLIEVQAGDLIKVDEGSEAIIRFFDDTEVRIGQNSELLISQLAVSPAFGRQGIIELSLHKGTTWVQTLNVEDGYAGFAISTRDAVVRTLNGTFYVTTAIGQPTSVFVFDNKTEITSLITDTRQPVETVKVAANQKAGIYGAKNQPTITVSAVSQQDRSNAWVQNNLNRDKEHLTVLREKGTQRLEQLAGTLPGHMLYPIKQTKERLRLAFSSDSNLDLQIEIANRRLNEALVLFESGEQEKGMEALTAYQTIARQIAEGNGSEELTTKLIIPHQKALASELPNDAVTGLVKEALHQTAEILADDNPIELEKVRLASSVQRLEDVMALVEEGDTETAKERLASHQPSSGEALVAAEALEDEEAKKTVLQEVLELRQDELTLLKTLSEMLAADEEELTAMIQSATEASETDVEATLAVALPLLPELQKLMAQPSAAEIRMVELIDKIYIYNSWTGQQNQIERLLKNELDDPDSIDYLISVRDNLEGRAYDYLNVRILQLQRKADFQKHKAVQRKIEEAQKLREA